MDHYIANDNDATAAAKVVKPKMWKAVLNNMFSDLVLRGLLVDATFSTDNTTVAISTVNPDRFNTTFKYKRSGVVRVSDTTAEAGFNVGILTAN